MKFTLNCGDQLTAVMGGAAATTNPAFLIEEIPTSRHSPMTRVMALNGATAVNLSAPTENTTDVTALSCFNVDTASVTITLTLVRATVSYTLAKVTLLVGDHWLIDSTGMHIYDANGNLRQSFTSPYLPSNTLFQFGSGTGTAGLEGNLYAYADGTGVQPAATGADKVVLVYSLPANSLDGTRFRGLICAFSGNKANNAHTCQAKIIFNPSTAVVGSTVGGSGTTIADSGASTTNGGVGWSLEGQVYKYGIANSNTQICQELGTIVGTTHGGVGLATAATATENAAILIAFTLNATTTATDITGFFASVNILN